MVLSRVHAWCRRSGEHLTCLDGYCKKQKLTQVWEHVEELGPWCIAGRMQSPVAVVETVWWVLTRSAEGQHVAQRFRVRMCCWRKGKRGRRGLHTQA